MSWTAEHLRRQHDLDQDYCGMPGSSFGAVSTANWTEVVALGCGTTANTYLANDLTANDVFSDWW